MTKVDIEESDEETCIANFLAKDLVGQVLDEAVAITKAAIESGQPLQYIEELIKSIRCGKLSEHEQDILTYTYSKEHIIDMNETNSSCNTEDNFSVVTSTPQKKSIFTVETNESSQDVAYIGQGDEELDIQNELGKSTSMFINNLFDMSEVERIFIGENVDVIQNDSEPSELFAQAMSKIMESYVNATLNIPLDNNETTVMESDAVIDGSKDYDYLLNDCELLPRDVGIDITFCIGDDIAYDQIIVPETMKITEVTKEDSGVAIKAIEEKHENDNAAYENAYLTLNRDYDQYSDDDDVAVLKDPKGMALQEVELLTTNSSREDLPAKIEQEVKVIKKLAKKSKDESRQVSLVQRCRMQGSRLLACIRGWWRRKTPGKRKESRVKGSIRDMCPLSPDARRRAASLMDQRQLDSPSPSRSNLWKFNTVNEVLVKSSHWKDYTFEDTNPDESGEY